MTSSIGQSIEALCSEQGLDRDMVIEAMKDAVKAAARKQFRTQDKTGDNIQVDWNNDEGAIEISLQKTVVEEVENDSAELSLVEAQELAGDEIEIGDMLQIPLPQEEMGRIAAQTAKQILRGSAQVHHVPALFHHTPIGRPQDDAPASCEHAATRGDQFGESRFLQVAKTGLTFAFEIVTNRATYSLLNDGIRISEGEVKPQCQAPADARLSRARQPYQNDRAIFRTFYKASPHELLLP